jgi:ATP-dependent Clp protease ATP-binding subunit ClpA
MTGMAWAGRLGIVIAIIVIERASPALAWFLVVLAAGGSVCAFVYNGRFLPAPALELIDRGLGKHGRKPEPKTPTVIDETELAGHLKSRVIGQDEVIDALARRLRQRLAARREGKPVAVMCFAGAPGVGKTYLAKVLAEKLYGSDQHLHVFEMAKFQQGFSATSLFGVPAGLQGSGEPGLIPRALRDTPNSIILLDEFEKASRNIHLQFLSAWNDGFVTDLGTSTKFPTTETIFVLTTNAGSSRIKELTSDPKITQDELNRLIKSALLDADFAPEILSRIDDVFAFRDLAGLDIARVVALEIERKTREYQLAIAGHGIDPVILMDAIDTFTEKKPKGGVRDIAREIEDQIADGLMEAAAADAHLVRFEADGKRVRVIPITEDEAQQRGESARVERAATG